MGSFLKGCCLSPPLIDRRSKWGEPSGALNWHQCQQRGWKPEGVEEVQNSQVVWRWDDFSSFIFLQGNIGKEIMAMRPPSEGTVPGPARPPEGSSGHARVGLHTRVCGRGWRGRNSEACPRGRGACSVTVESVDFQARAEDEKDCLPFSSVGGRGTSTLGRRFVHLRLCRK